jgi:hypothetical protein
MLGFEEDKRPQCNKTNKDDGVFCVMPTDACEIYIRADESCFGNSFDMCLSWSNIVLAIFIANSIQMIFEASLLFALEVTYTPTPLEKLQYPERFNESSEG